MPRKPHPEKETETFLGITAAAEDDIAECHKADSEEEVEEIMPKLTLF